MNGWDKRMVDGWVGRMNEQMDGWTGGWDGQMEDGRAGGADGCTRRMNGWGGQMGKWDVWMDGWVSGMKKTHRRME